MDPVLVGQPRDRLLAFDPATGEPLALMDGTSITAARTAADSAMAGADVVCATTHADEPVIAREHVSDGMHLCSVGFNPAGREVDEATVRDALVVVESREAALAPFPGGANDLLWPIRDGAITPEHIHAELGELVSGVRPARTDEGQITLYKSVGVAVQDAAAAALVLARARDRGLGTEVTSVG